VSVLVPCHKGPKNESVLRVGMKKERKFLSGEYMYFVRSVQSELLDKVINFAIQDL
jgi:hypothetical protein